MTTERTRVPSRGGEHEGQLPAGPPADGETEGAGAGRASHPGPRGSRPPRRPSHTGMNKKRGPRALRRSLLLTLWEGIGFTSGFAHAGHRAVPLCPLVFGGR